MILRRIYNKIKRQLVKKIEVEKHYLQDGEIIFEFKLSNFFGFQKNLKAELFIDEESHPLSTKLPKNNHLVITIPNTLLAQVGEKAVLKIKFNKKTAWITKADGYDDIAESLLIGTKYLSTRVSKNIVIKNQFSDLNFVEQEIEGSIVSSGFERMHLQLHTPQPEENKQVEVYAFNNNRFRILTDQLLGRDQTIEIEDFSMLAVGLWKLFISIDDQLHPLTLENPDNTSFNAYFHQINLVKRNSSYYMELKPHKLSVSPIGAIEVDDQVLELSFSLKEPMADTSFTLSLNDSKSGISKAYELTEKDGKLTALVPMFDLYDNLFTKRFFILTHDEEPKVWQFDLDPLSFNSTNIVFRPIFNSQIVKLKFYRRKDNSLGLKISRTKLKKVITSLDQLKVEGSIGSLDGFINSRAYLILEDRLSLEMLKVPIENSFSIDLMEELDLIHLKSKDKTIFDFFVIIENEFGEITRKEKIKYKYADYKKDKFYTYQVLPGPEDKNHHFMVTTTPFGNLKIETFSISNAMVLPQNPEEKDENIWLLGERTNTAQDNGIVMFDWLQENTGIDAYYVIDEESPDYARLQNNPNVLIFGSERHFEIAIKAKVLLCTHDFENILPYKPARGFFGYEHTIKVFLQHGVLGRKNVEYHKKYYDLPFDIFIVSSEAEKHEVVMHKMGYEEDEVAVTGLARFDRLVQRDKPKDILLMPTWRDWINTDEQFLSSEYYFAYSNLIQNPKLHTLLEENDINLNFYPHYRAQNYFETEVNSLHDRVKFIPLGSDTVQSLLIDHALLITDYSSVSFDFSLLNKPVIFYHFDVERFFRRGILRPVEDTFLGGIATYEEELLSLIEDRILHEFANYDIDLAGISKYQDQQNSERIYQQVQSLIAQPVKISN